MYSISETGIITGKRFKSPLSIHKSNYGYYRVALSKKGVAKAFLVHRLVALAFIPNPENKRYVHHKSGNRADNSAENLEWVTPKENTHHILWSRSSCPRCGYIFT